MWGFFLFLPLPVCDGYLEGKFRPRRGKGTGAEVLGRRVPEAMRGFLSKGGFPLRGAATVWAAVVSSQEAVSYFEHISSPVCVSL